MNGSQLSGRTVGFGLSVAITSILSTVLVLVKETHAQTVMTWMTNATTHHWITHGIIDVVLFVVIGLGLSKLNGGKGIEMKAGMLVALIVAALVASYAVTSGFYLTEG